MTIQIPPSPAAPKTLPGMGGTNPAGISLGVNNRYLTVNGQPRIPVMGEFQYSRWPGGAWGPELEKMRAGGVDVVSTYIFWIHHEEEQGVWDFSGCRDLRAFLKECARLNFPVVMRLGPWCHGECRNGGFPDWLVRDKSIRPRSADPGYLARVRALYHKLGETARGLLWKDGGPVLAVQLENEYCGNDLEYIPALKRLAREAGFDVPFYTVTGWGGAPVPDGEVLPMMGAYPDGFWYGTTEKLPPSVHYLLYPFRDDVNIGADLLTGNANKKLSHDPAQYPFLLAELGGGMQSSAQRRPTPSGADAEALALCKLGAGMNLPGYYVYHGGTNPDGRLSTLQESKASGYYNDLPVKSYDFIAPIRESGEIGENYRKLKRLHLFLHAFGHILAPGVCCLPPEPVTDQTNAKDLRVIVRHNHGTGGGFLFVNNRQRQYPMADHRDVEIQIQTPGGHVVFPKMDFADGEYALLPYKLPLGDAVLESSNAQPLCRLGERYFFFTARKPEYRWKSGKAEVITLSPEEAENAWLLGGSLYITEGDLRESNGRLLISSCAERVKVRRYGPSGPPEDFAVDFPRAESSCDFHQTGERDGAAEYEIRLGEMPGGVSEAYLDIAFTGDRAELYLGGRLAADWFTTGLPWRVALSRLDYPRQLTLKVYETLSPVYYELPVPSGRALNAVRVDLRHEREL